MIKEMAIDLLWFSLLLFSIGVSFFLFCVIVMIVKTFVDGCKGTNTSSSIKENHKEINQ